MVRLKDRKEYEIRGAFIAQDQKGDKDFWDTFIGFIEDYNWYFGGDLNDKQPHLITIDGVLDVSKTHVDPDELHTLLTELAERNGYKFSGSVNQLAAWKSRFAL